MILFKTYDSEHSATILFCGFGIIHGIGTQCSNVWLIQILKPSLSCLRGSKYSSNLMETQRHAEIDCGTVELLTSVDYYVL